MKLSKLIYLCVKSATDLGDDAFTYLSFITGEAASDPDYSSSINRTIGDVNAFFQRLVSLEKIPALVEIANTDDGFINTKKLRVKPSKVISVFQKVGNGYVTLEWRAEGRGYLSITSRYDLNRPVYIQYRPQVPYFTESDLPNVAVTESEDGYPIYAYKGNLYGFGMELDESDLLEAVEEDDIDLDDAYGIGEQLTPLAMQWCRAFQNDLDVAQGRAQMVDTESRIADVQVDEVLYVQDMVYGG